MNTSESPVLLIVVLAGETLLTAVAAGAVVVAVLRSRARRRPDPGPEPGPASVPSQLGMGLFVSAMFVAFFVTTAWLWGVTLSGWGD